MVETIQQLCELELTQEKPKEPRKEIWVYTKRDCQLRSFALHTPCMTLDQTRQFLLKDLPETDFEPFLIYDHAWVEVEQSSPPITIELKVVVTVPFAGHTFAESFRTALMRDPDLRLMSAHVEVTKKKNEP